MSYRTRARASRKYQLMRDAKERHKPEGDLEPGPHELPDKRREIIVRDYDFGLVEHVFTLHKTKRIDSYRVMIDGKEIGAPHKDTMGWTGAMRTAEKAFMRVHSPNTI